MTGRGRFSTETARRKAREQAEEAYESGWNLRPAKDPPKGMVELIRQVCAQSRSVHWATLAEAREPYAREIRFLLGIRMRPGAAVSFEELSGRLVEELTAAVTGGREVEITDLDSDVEPLNVDGKTNPYLLIASQGL